MIDVQVNHEEVLKLYKEQLEKHLQKVDHELVFWDAKELQRRTCMSWNFIQEKFFYDDRFPRHKVGQKWFFPANETKKFLEEWLHEQPNH